MRKLIHRSSFSVLRSTFRLAKSIDVHFWTVSVNLLNNNGSDRLIRTNNQSNDAPSLSKSQTQANGFISLILESQWPYQYASAENITALTPCAYQPDRLSGGSMGKTNLEVSFALNMLSALICSARSYPTMQVDLTIGTPAVRPSRSSRTRDRSSQFSQRPQRI